MSEYEQPPTYTFSEDIYEDGDYRKIAPRVTKTNTLLVRSQLGKVRTSTYNLPQQQFVYGQVVDMPEGTNAATSVNSWQEHMPNAVAVPNRDFVRLNKYAAMNGVTTSKDVADFRSVNDIRQPPANLSNNSNNVYFPPPETTFGRPSGKTIPIVRLIQNDFQRRAIADDRSNRSRELSESMKPKKTRLQHTKASIGHTKVPAPEPKKQFKMKRFDSVPSRALTLAGMKAVSVSEPMEEKTQEDVAVASS